MKKFLPIILLLVGALVLGGAFLALRGRGGEEVVDEEANLRTITLGESPFTSLTPTEDGHWLNLVVDGVKVEGASSMDYELLYKTQEGQTQGVPGSVPLNGGAKVERKLLLGSESSGKFRYDDGVTEGTLNLRFRDGNGKLIGKLSTTFHLQENATEITSMDEKVTFSLNDEPDGVFFVTMDTFGLPKDLEGGSSPVGIFASTTDELPGALTREGKSKRFNGTDWEESSDGQFESIGVFAIVQ